MVVVLTDLLQDVDDDALNEPAPENLPGLPLTASERGHLDSVRPQARRRLLLSSQMVARSLRFKSHPNIRGVLCQVAGQQDQDLSQARQIIDMESGVLQRLAFTRAASRAYWMSVSVSVTTTPKYHSGHKGNSSSQHCCNT